MDFDNLLKKRASVRNYSVESVPYRKILDAIEAASLAPSPGNLSLLRYIVIQNLETIEKIAQACQQPFISGATNVVVVCSVPKEAEIMYDLRSSRYIRNAAGASIENFLLKVTEMGLVSCWIGAFSDLMIRSELKIPDSVEIEAILPVAYPQKGDKTKQKPKPELGNIIFFEKYGNKISAPPPKVKR
jgi:nitroreductase